MSVTANASLFVIAAPSGAGKTTLVKKLIEKNPSLTFSISYTTRKQRSTEEHGRDYFFVDKDAFNALKEQGELLESAIVFDNHYGTSRSQVEEHIDRGNHVLLEIDWQGAEQVRASMPGCVTVFILPPSRPELERRLRGRKTDSDEVIERRLRDALGDMSHWHEFDHVIINDDLDQAVEDLQAIIEGESRNSRASNPALAERVKNILV
ncbi:MAG: guanylate kinase [Woeseiaceae bacterium]|jgi:guanylate kinase|nr:guanylate kinase [Woeseiaceae bacterium]